jgi:type 1 glutamine amidotransferase
VNLHSQSVKKFEVTSEWLNKIAATTPSKTTVKAKKRNVLLFSLHTGFNHWVIPHSAAVVQTIADKTESFTVTQTMDVNTFTKKNLKKYDVVVLNNNCSVGPKRDLFWDALESENLTEEARNKKAAELEKCLLTYVRKGGGLVVLHGGIVMQNNSEEVSKMIGGSFDYHPVHQLLNVKLVDADHEMVQAFDGQGFQHMDEPYFFKNAYDAYDFHPLLYIETNELKLKKPVTSNIKYISWIKRYGKGRVFYSSPSHNAQSYDNPNLISFIMNGLQYAAGDLKCDDSPIGVKPE